MLFKDKELPTYQERVNHVRNTLASIRTHKLIERQPELKYTEIILMLLDCQLVETEYRLLQRSTIKGQLKKLFKCRDSLDFQLNGMVTRVDDLHRELKEGLEQSKKFGKVRRDRVPTKKEGKARWTQKLSIVSERSEGEGDEVFEDAVESQSVEGPGTATTAVVPPVAQAVAATTTPV